MSEALLAPPVDAAVAKVVRDGLCRAEKQLPPWLLYDAAHTTPVLATSAYHSAESFGVRCSVS